MSGNYRKDPLLDCSLDNGSLSCRYAFNEERGGYEEIPGDGGT